MLDEVLGAVVVVPGIGALPVTPPPTVDVGVGVGIGAVVGLNAGAVVGLNSPVKVKAGAFTFTVEPLRGATGC